MAQIEIRNVYKIFGGNPQSVLPEVRSGAGKDDILARTGHTIGLSDISLSVAKGEIFVVMGLSGSGKSTLIRHLNRLIEPTAGSISFEGTDVLELSASELREFRRHRISMVFQRFGLLPHRTVLENVAFGLEIQSASRAARRDKAEEWIEAVGLKGYEDQYPSQLSGGMQQRVGLARALCTDPDVLLMDEPFSALDPLIRSDMQEQLVALQARLAKTIIFITHDLDEALRIGDRIAILKDGSLSQVGTPAQILLEPADDYVRAFVKDVNRARALTIDVIMRPPKLRLTDETIGEALRKMHEAGAACGWVVEDQSYRGVVSQEGLSRANGESEETRVAEMCEECDILPPEVAIEDAVATALQSDLPIPVVDEDGMLCGVVERSDIVRVLEGVKEAGTPESEPEPEPKHSTAA